MSYQSINTSSGIKTERKIIKQNKKKYVILCFSSRFMDLLQIKKKLTTKSGVYQTRKKIFVVNHLSCDFKDGRRVPFRVHNFDIF